MKFICFILTALIFFLLYVRTEQTSSKEFNILTDSISISDSLKKNLSDSLINAINIKEGKILYRKNCGKCHTLYEPDDFSIKVWKKNLKEMRIKAGISEDVYNKIFAYLKANSQK